MPVIKDKLWKHPGNPGMIVVDSHASIQQDGRLFMGYGVAQEAIKRIPNIEFQCGREVITHAVDGVYGFLLIRPPRPQEKIIGFGLFQTRVNWEEGADPEIIKYSMECLLRFVDEQPDLKIRMNFPGLPTTDPGVEEVAPLLIPLPSTVTVCHQGEVQPTMPSSFMGFKALYLEVERMLQGGQSQLAIEYLMKNGYDIQSAMEQVKAVDRCMRERAESEAKRVRQWRGSDVQLRFR